VDNQPIVEWLLTGISWLQSVMHLAKDGVPVQTICCWVQLMLHGSTPVYVQLWHRRTPEKEIN